MRKILSYFFILLGAGLLVISNSRSMMQAIFDKRNHITGWLADAHWGDAGDLVSMSYLDDEKKFFAKKDYHFVKPSDTGCRNIALYVWGDSYVKDIPDTAYGAISDYHFGRRGYSDLRYRLDPHKKNILIIETAERFVGPDYLHLFPIFDHVIKDSSAVAFSTARPAPPSYASFFGIKLGDLFNPDINQNLEYNLFQYSFINPIRQLKARSVYRYFNRASGDVAVSENGKYLFLKETITTHDLFSSYYPIGQQELSQIMRNFELVYTHYKKEGFDEVYFSIIPNPATILQPERYNKLIPTMQELTAKEGMPVIDLYSPFTHSADPAGLYRAGDTHWNNNGLQVWLRIVNGELTKICR